MNWLSRDWWGEFRAQASNGCYSHPRPIHISMTLGYDWWWGQIHNMKYQLPGHLTCDKNPSLIISCSRFFRTDVNSSKNQEAIHHWININWEHSQKKIPICMLRSNQIKMATTSSEPNYSCIAKPRLPRVETISTMYSDLNLVLMLPS